MVNQAVSIKAFELCQTAATDRLKPTPGNGDYECGSKFGSNEKYSGMSMCKESRKRLRPWC
jgi:hypothetical protein